jgi:hypothetical protein
MNDCRISFGPNRHPRLRLPRNSYRPGDRVPFDWPDGTPGTAVLGQVSMKNHHWDWWTFTDALTLFEGNI